MRLRASILPELPTGRRARQLALVCGLGVHEGRSGGLTIPVESVVMRAAELVRRLKSLGCIEIRQKGSHLLIECGDCRVPIPMHAGRDLDRGLLYGIEAKFERCLGKDWLRRR